jgi:ABC-type multidrug transport system fused ATPase/permease subunit
MEKIILAVAAKIAYAPIVVDGLDARFDGVQLGHRQRQLFCLTWATLRPICILVLDNQLAASALNWVSLCNV